MLSFQKRSFRLRTQRWFDKFNRGAQGSWIWASVRFMIFTNRYFVEDVVIVIKFVYTVLFFSHGKQSFCECGKIFFWRQDGILMLQLYIVSGGHSLGGGNTGTIRQNYPQNWPSS
jgi:hypothetical protein